MDLLDLALSADTVNTVKNLRVIMESGVEPLALMSQLATVITDILAGCYDYTKERRRRKFFRHQPCESESLIEHSICLINQNKPKKKKTLFKLMVVMFIFIVKLCTYFIIFSCAIHVLLFSLSL